MALPLLALLALLLGSSLVWAEDDFYEALGLEAEREDAAERDVKAAWRKLSKQFHPDLCGESCRERYQKIQRAYEVLGDRKKRKVYDIRGDEGLKQYEQPHQQSNMMDPFAMFFGGGGQQQQQGGANKGANLEMMMLVTLEDIYSGAAHSVKFKKQKLCRACRGTGALSKDDLVVCSHCKGSGTEVRTIQIMPGFHTQQQAPCSHCSGKGKMVGKKCTTCRGQKVVQSSMALGVDVEQGTPDGFDLVYDMEADQSPDQIPGDVVFTIQTAPHDRFTRNGNDLAMTVVLTLEEALLGFEKLFKHLDGHEVELEETTVTQFNRRRVLKEEGMPVHHVPSERGDLVITYQVELPTMLTNQQREKIASLF